MNFKLTSNLFYLLLVAGIVGCSATHQDSKTLEFNGERTYIEATSESTTKDAKLEKTGFKARAQNNISETEPQPQDYDDSIKSNEARMKVVEQRLTELIKK